jgi:Tfp pilus assembly pilus retraction ATPase PilT
MTEQVTAGRAATAYIDGLFKLMVQQKASDLHLAVGLPPMIRKDGHMQPLDPAAPLLDAAMMGTCLIR